MNSPRSNPPMMLSAVRLEFEDLGLQRGGVEFESVSPQALGAIKRKIGVDQQTLPIDGVAEGARDADAHAEAALVAFVRDGLSTAPDDIAGEFVETVHACVRVADDDEFVAARSRHEVAVA